MKCKCTESPGWTTVKCCNLCGLPVEGECWSVPELKAKDEEIKKLKAQLWNDCDTLNQIIDEERAEIAKLREALEALSDNHECFGEQIERGCDLPGCMIRIACARYSAIQKPQSTD